MNRHICLIILFIMVFEGLAVAGDINMARIVQLESSGNVFAQNGSHYGLCQIGKAVLADYNRKHGTIWEPVDLFNGVINMRVASWYMNTEIPRLLRHYRLADTDANRLTAWRFGVGAVINGRVAAKYINAYHRL